MARSPVSMYICFLQVVICLSKGNKARHLLKKTGNRFYSVTTDSKGKAGLHSGLHRAALGFVKRVQWSTENS